MLSAGNLVVHEGNTLLPKDEVEMLTVLRINRGWMEYMRAHHAEEAPGAGQAAVQQDGRRRRG